jgi:GNAT superfamily N-acetyltransferase
VTPLTVRPMTSAEFTAWQDGLVAAYAVAQVAAGRWAAADAHDRARLLVGQSLPEGIATPRMLFLQAADAQAAVVGRVWLGLDHPNGTHGAAFLYDLEVVEERRGQGYGRALLEQAEMTAYAAGATALELNVFGRNSAATGLYVSSGYVTTSRQMRKELG